MRPGPLLAQTALAPCSSSAPRAWAGLAKRGQVPVSPASASSSWDPCKASLITADPLRKCSLPVPGGREPGTTGLGAQRPQLLAPGASLSPRRTDPPSPPRLTSRTLLASGLAPPPPAASPGLTLRGVGIPLQRVFGLQGPSLTLLPGASSSFLSHPWPGPWVSSVWAVVEPEPHLQGPLTFKSRLSFWSAHAPTRPAGRPYPRSPRRPALRHNSLPSPLPPPSEPPSC